MWYQAASPNKHPFVNACMSAQRTARVRLPMCCAERQKTDLERIIKRKAKEVEDQVQDLGMDWLEEKLQDAMSQPLAGDQQFQFGRALSEAMMQVRLDQMSVPCKCYTCTPLPSRRRHWQFRCGILAPQAYAEAGKPFQLPYTSSCNTLRICRSYDGCRTDAQHVDFMCCRGRCS